MVCIPVILKNTETFKNGLLDFLKEKTWSWTCECGTSFYDLIDIRSHLIRRPQYKRANACMDYKIARKQYTENRRKFLGADTNLPIIELNNCKKSHGELKDKFCPVCNWKLSRNGTLPLYSCEKGCFTHVHTTFLQKINQVNHDFRKKNLKLVAKNES